ncbi:AAA family ATPase [Bacilliculturomica massiliensis]|uniref:AAA family ATPase n=1 Tax=Bacilliculturomica massiliensis TaxID=1917867 RepID=UPI002ECFC105
MGDYRPLPIGVNSFTDMREGGYYYVDKTLFIKELLDMKGKVTLFTRPRRFGKTLNMTMLRDFFQMPVDEMAAEKQRALFAGLKIVEAEETYMSQMGQYPVIFLSLKSTAGDNWEEAFAALCNEIEIEFRRHRSALCTAELEEDRGRGSGSSGLSSGAAAVVPMPGAGARKKSDHTDRRVRRAAGEGAFQRIL